MTLTATCHCGATKIEAPHLPTRAAECNCTYCSRTGAVWGYYGEGELTIVKAETDRVYSASNMGNHHFCGTCGMQTYGDSPDWSSLYNDDGTPKTDDPNAVPTTRTYGINLRLIQDFDFSSITVEKLDGRNSW